MAKNRQRKEHEVQQLNDLLSNKGVVLFSYNGLKVTEVEDLRGKLREESASMTVAKRTLLLKVLAEKGMEIDPSVIDGPVAVATADDEVAPARVVKEFQENFEQVTFYGGVLEQSFVDAAKVSQLASLPSKQELLAKAVGSMKAPISGFVNVLGGNLRGLVNVLNAIKDSKA